MVGHVGFQRGQMIGGSWLGPARTPFADNWQTPSFRVKSTVVFD